MPKSYIVASINVTDPEGYEAYVNGAVKVTKEVGGKLIISQFNPSIERVIPGAARFR